MDLGNLIFTFDHLVFPEANPAEATMAPKVNRLNRIDISYLQQTF